MIQEASVAFSRDLNDLFEQFAAPARDAGGFRLKGLDRAPLGDRFVGKPPRQALEIGGVFGQLG